MHNDLPLGKMKEALEALAKDSAVNDTSDQRKGDQGQDD